MSAVQSPSIKSTTKANGLAASNSVLKTLVASIDEPMFMMEGADNHVKWFNHSAADLLPEIAVGLDIDQLDQSLSKAIKMAIETFDGANPEQQMVFDSGIENHATAYCTITHDSQRQVVIRLPQSRFDNTQLQKYMADRELLFTTSRTISVSEMATTLAHEINQPIGSIANILRGTKSRLEKMGTANEEILLALDKALKQSQFASRIIARIRDFTQSRQPKRVECDVHELLSESVNLLDWVLAQSAVSVKLHSQAGLAIVNGDATMLQQVFTNLIRNAVEAMDDASLENKQLDVHIQLQERNVQIEIADRGHGLTQETQDNLFVPFVTQKTQGMGVGLNICRSFVELHQGRLWLAPNDMAGCTSFVLLAAA